MRKFAALLALLMLLPCAAALAEGEVVLTDDSAATVEEVVSGRALQYGDEGDDVLSLQRRLTDLFYYTGNLSGRYREGTRAAVKDFQEDFGLEVTGMADAETQALLYGTLYRPLRYGSTGEDVKELQTRLTALGYYTGKISGNYLEGTRAAIGDFQQKMGQEANGIADPATQELLYGGDALSKNDKTVMLATPAPDSDSFLVDENAPANAAATPATAVAFTKKVKRGDTGKLVKQIQTRLTELGYYTGPISGNFLSKTTAAVKAFQQQNGLEIDGIVGEIAWNTLFNDANVVLPEHTPRPTPEPTPVPFAITVDVNNQVTTVYGRDENGDYTVVIREMLCSTGTKSYPSDVGDWVLNGRTARWCYFPKWGGHAQYWTRINKSIAFHSVVYNSVNTMDLSVSSYKNLGKRASHGCIRLLVSDAKWIYDNVGEGTVVTVREDLPADPELVASLKVPPLDYSRMLPQQTPEPTPEPLYLSGSQPPLPLEKLAKNDSSEAVYWMQCKLKELGYYQGKCSGTFLSGTANAVKAFQKDQGLKASGTATVETLEKLYAQELATPIPIQTPAPLTEAPSPTPASTDGEG